jgi:hypothetical protein
MSRTGLRFPAGYQTPYSKRQIDKVAKLGFGAHQLIHESTAMRSAHIGSNNSFLRFGRRVQAPLISLFHDPKGRI